MGNLDTLADSSRLKALMDEDLAVREKVQRGTRKNKGPQEKRTPDRKSRKGHKGNKQIFFSKKEQ